MNSLQSHWRRGKRITFFVKCCQRLGPVKDTVLRRELASIALATRKTKNFFRGMLSAFRAGVSVIVGFHKPCCLVICSLQSPLLGVIFYPAYADHTDWPWSCREWRHVQQTQDDSTFGKAAGAGSEEPWKNTVTIFTSLQSFSHML